MIWSNCLSHRWSYKQESTLETLRRDTAQAESDWLERIAQAQQTHEAAMAKAALQHSEVRGTDRLHASALSASVYIGSNGAGATHL
jgi:hypothetical protein